MSNSNAIDLSNFANFAGYKYEPRVTEPIGLITSPRLVLKLYSMLKESTVLLLLKFKYGKNHSFTKEFFEEIREDLGVDLRYRRLKPYSGLGFAIVTEDTLNISRWDSNPETPYVLRSQLYSFDHSQHCMAKLDTRKFGILSDVWELGIVAHEKEAWKKYLASQRTDSDKRVYLDDMTEGVL